MKYNPEEISDLLPLRVAWVCKEEPADCSTRGYGKSARRRKRECGSRSTRSPTRGGDSRSHFRHLRQRFSNTTLPSMLICPVRAIPS
jgi:hypothetical protein